MERKIQFNKEQVAVVDGVRAVAVLGVIMLHWKNILLGPGGWLALLTTPGVAGVIIFFVVSGLCISLSKKADEPWPSFYVRRAFRLLPACWFSLTAYLVLLKVGWGKTVSGHDIWSSFLIVPNWFGAAGVKGWTGPGAELNPVLWSLQTEIELYCLFPLSLLLFRLMSKRAFLVLNVAISAGAWVVWLLLRQTFTYFPPFPVLCHWFIWNLGLCICFSAGETLRSPGRALALGLGGIGLGSVFLLLRNGYHSNLFSFWYFFTGVGTFFLLRWALVATPAILRQRALVLVGKRSYSYYLNHWPVAIIGTTLFSSKMVAGGFAVVALLVVGEFSYRLIELPFIHFGKSLADSLKLATAGVATEFVNKGQVSQI